MPRANNQADSETDFKVILRNAQGKFLAEDDNGFYFTTERRAAKVLNYLADHVAEQLHDLRQATKIELIPEPVPLEEVYESLRPLRGTVPSHNGAIRWQTVPVPRVR